MTKGDKPQRLKLRVELESYLPRLALPRHDRLIVKECPSLPVWARTVSRNYFSAAPDKINRTVNTNAVFKFLMITGDFQSLENSIELEVELFPQYISTGLGTRVPECSRCKFYRTFEPAVIMECLQTSTQKATVLI